MAVRSARELDDVSGADKEPRDFKKSFLLIGLAVLSWVATYVGMLELIEANMGELPIIHRVIIGFSVAMLMVMVVWLLDQMFQPHNSLPTKLIYGFGYLFLTLISVGFGFGFYWKVLESRSEASRSAESAVGAVQGSLYGAQTRLEQLQSTLVQLTDISTQKAAIEVASGTSCPNSRPGDGPRRKLREDDAARFTFATQFVKGRVADVTVAIAALDGDLAKIAKDDKSTIDVRSGTRNEFMKGLSRKLDNTVTGFNAFRTDPQLKQLRTDLAERAEKTTFADTKGGSYSCPDPQLQTALRGVVRAIDQLPELEKPKITAVEGSEATIEAFRRLTASFYGLMSFKMPPSADELRTLQQKAVQSVEGGAAAAAKLVQNTQPGLSSRDYVPLAIALFVDLCLLLVSMGQGTHRLQRLVPTMQKAEKFQVEEWLGPFNVSIDLLRDVVFDYHGAYYVAVPLIARPVTTGLSEEDKAKRLASFHVLSAQAKQIDSAVTSVEQLNLFKRVLWPDVGAPLSWLLWTNVNAAKKRLTAQGSRFANANGFRFYRFTRGMWPDMVLGAVRGTARREETVRAATELETKRQAAKEHRSSQSSPQPQANDLGQGIVSQNNRVNVADRSARPSPVTDRPSRRPADPMPDWRTRSTRSDRAKLRLEPEAALEPLQGRRRDRDDGLGVWLSGQQKPRAPRTAASSAQASATSDTFAPPAAQAPIVQRIEPALRPLEPSPFELRPGGRLAPQAAASHATAIHPAELSQPANLASEQVAPRFAQPSAPERDHDNIVELQPRRAPAKAADLTVEPGSQSPAPQTPGGQTEVTLTRTIEQATFKVPTSELPQSAALADVGADRAASGYSTMLPPRLLPTLPAAIESPRADRHLDSEIWDVNDQAMTQRFAATKLGPNLGSKVGKDTD